MHRFMEFSLRLLGLLLATAVFSISSAQAAAGRIYFVYGEVYVERGGAQTPAGVNTLVETGDVIVTKDDSRVQWRMADDSYFALRPNSKFKIEDFQPQAAGGSGKAFYSLLAGGFRSITGLIGKGDTSAYRVSSPVATMGIRGTDHTHILCQKDCDWAGGSMTDGLYTRVDSGTSLLSNTDGSLDVKAGQYAKTASPPTLLPGMPAVFANWSVDFAIDISLAFAPIKGKGDASGSVRIEGSGQPCVPVPSPSQPCP